MNRVGPCPACQANVRLVAPGFAPGVDAFVFAFYVEAGPDRVGEQVFLGGTNPITIGKRADNSLPLDDPSVSRYHCRLIRIEDGWRIEDEGSKNGVRVNGDRVTGADLSNGDVIRIGHFTLHYIDTTTIVPTDVAAAERKTGSDDGTRDDLYALAEMEHAQPAAEVAPPILDPETGPTSPAHASVSHDKLMPGARGTDSDWIEAPQRSFWGDAAWSFVCFLDGGNMATLIAVCVVNVLVTVVGLVPVLGCGGLLLQGAFRAWLCAFYFNVVAETARGEDALPEVRVSSIYDDLFLPVVRFAGCWLVVFLPAIIVAIVMFRETGKVSWDLVAMVGAVGLFFWPIMVLGTAIGGGLPLLSIPVLALTVARTIIPYILVCVLVALAMTIAIGTQIGFQVLLSSSRGATLSPAAPLVFDLLGSVVQAYAWIVAMRLIGLYYRHFKSRFPWQAE